MNLEAGAILYNLNLMTGIHPTKVTIGHHLIQIGKLTPLLPGAMTGISSMVR